MRKLYPLLSVLFLIYWGCLGPGDMDFGSGSGSGDVFDFGGFFINKTAK